jgi:hypothetical protein
MPAAAAMMIKMLIRSQKIDPGLRSRGSGTRRRGRRRNTPGHGIGYRADLLPGLIDHRLADQHGQAHQRVAAR